MRGKINKLLIKIFPFYKRAVNRCLFLEKEILKTSNILDDIDKRYFQEIDKEHVKRQYMLLFGKEINLENPETFNEKLQWLKIYQRDPVMSIMSDKYRVREFLKERGCGQYLNELYGVYNNIEELINDLDSFPDQFVVKVNHNCGGVYIVRDKKRINFHKLYELEKMLSINNYTKTISKRLSLSGKMGNEFFRQCEWNYKNIEPCLIVEKYLENYNNSLYDYKLFCFNGEVKYIQVDIDRFTNHKKCFYDINWEKQPFTIKHPMSDKKIPKPLNFDKMVEIAEMLSAGYPHLRVDMYNIEGNIIFGEFTFYHGSGVYKFYPEYWDMKFGEFIDLNGIPC